VTLVDGTYYAYATSNLTYNIPVTTSTDLVEWGRQKEALSKPPIWQPTSKGGSWAPEVWETSAGWVMYYTGRNPGLERACLAMAVGDSPEGPYVDESREPFLCQVDLGGSIDPSPFLDADGKRYLLWKNDGNHVGMRTNIYIQELSEDGLSLVGEPVETGETNDQAWERGVVEAPTLVLHDGTYYLFYSGNVYSTRQYAVGYATSKDVMGPYVDAEENPIVATTEEAAGPGHQSVVEGPDGDLWLAYHAADPKNPNLAAARGLWLDELVLGDGKAAVEGPDPGPQATP
jgi:beta-xylosidase